MPRRNRNLGTVNLNESAPVTYKGDFPEQMSDEELMAALEADQTNKTVEDTTSFKFEPHRPSRMSDDDIKGLARGALSDEEFADVYKQPKRERTDFKTDEIRALMSELDKAQASDKAKTRGSRRLAISQVGEEAATVGIGGLQPSATRYPMPEKFSDAKAVEQKASLSDKLQTGEMKRQNPEEERDLKKTLQDLKTRADVEKYLSERKHKKEMQEDKQAFDWKKVGFTEDQHNARADADRRAGLVKGAWAQSSSVGRGVGREAAQEEYSQARMYSKQIPELGKKYHARGPVTSHMSNQADERLSSYGLLKPALDEAALLLEQDPRGQLFWGSDARARLDSALAAAWQADTKFQGNGVMNGPDLLMSQRIVGDGATFENFVSANGIARIKQYASTIEKQLDARMAASGYDPGEGSPMSIDDVHKRAGGAAGSATVPLTPADVEAADRYVRGGAPPQTGQNQPSIPGGPPAPSKPPKKVIRNGKVVMSSDY